MDLICQVEETIKTHQLLQPGDWVVCGLSGGPDSVAMVHALHRLREKLGIRLWAVHINHQLRGEAADRDQQYAEAFCADLGIPCESCRFDVSALARQLALSTEDAGRRVRYDTFFAKARELSEQGARTVKIAVAQNRDDQAETVLMRIMRGTGLDGLSGIEYKRRDGVVRPVLDVSRKDVEAYCQKEGLQPCLDETNLEPVYTRNRIRLELLPYMREHFNENITGALTRLAEIAQEDSSFLEQATGRLLADHAQQKSGGQEWVFPVEVLKAQHPAIRKRILSALLKAAGASRNVTAHHLNQADQLALNHSKPSEMDFPGGFVMKLRYGSACFSKRNSLAEWQGRELGKLKQTVIEKADFDLSAHQKAGELYIRSFDLESVEQRRLALTLRTRREGDYIRPLGMSGKKKIQDYFVDKKIKREERDYVPLVALGPEIIWVVGGQINENFKVKPETKRILLLEYVPNI